MRTITDCNKCKDAPFSNEKIQDAIHKFIVGEELDAYKITSNDHNVIADTFSQMSNTQRENANTILTSGKLDKLDALEEMLKELAINDAGYYESDSAKRNDAKGNPASDPKTVTYTRDVKKRKVTDNSNGYIQQKLLSNWTLLILTTTTDPWIDNRISTCSGNPHTIATHLTKEFITDAAHSSTRVIRNPRHVSQTGRDGTTPGNTPHDVRPPRANLPIIIRGIGVCPTSGHSGSLQVLS